MWIYKHAFFRRDEPELLHALKRKTNQSGARFIGHGMMLDNEIDCIALERARQARYVTTVIVNIWQLAKFHRYQTNYYLVLYCSLFLKSPGNMPNKLSFVRKNQKLFLTFSVLVANPKKLLSRRRMIDSWVHKIRNHGRRGKGTPESFPR